jgi:hypothetical protein
VTTLAAPDAFSTAGRDTGLPQDLWRGASVETARAVLPRLAARPLSAAASALARRVLATGAPGPRGAGDDPVLTGARAEALMNLGDVKAAAVILTRAPGLDRSAELSRAAAESALLANDDPRACAIAEALSVGRDDIYWLRLRTFCLALAGQTAQAQLTFDVAQAQAKDTAFSRLMSAKLTGAGSPGAPSLRNGLDYALSRSLALDLSAVSASPSVAAALATTDPDAPAPPPVADDLKEAAAALGPSPTAPGALDHLVQAAQGAADIKARARLQSAALLVAALDALPGAEARAALPGFSVAAGKAPVGRDLALQWASEQKRMGETALLALWTCTEAGTAGLAMGDRVRIVRALHLAGLDVDARAFALEGLSGLK